jgi:hypothetical protein
MRVGGYARVVKVRINKKNPTAFLDDSAHFGDGTQPIRKVEKDPLTPGRVNSSKTMIRMGRRAAST